jgi:uncharacterized protein
MKKPTSTSNEAIKIQCPRCGKETFYSTENAHRPFCSERCRTIDLGAWASEKYKVESEESVNFEDSELTDKEKN